MTLKKCSKIIKNDEVKILDCVIFFLTNLCDEENQKEIQFSTYGCRRVSKKKFYEYSMSHM